MPLAQARAQLSTLADDAMIRRRPPLWHVRWFSVRDGEGGVAPFAARDVESPAEQASGEVNVTISPVGLTQPQSAVYRWLQANSPADLPSVARAQGWPLDEASRVVQELVGQRVILVDATGRIALLDPRPSLAEQARTVRADVIARLSGFVELIEEFDDVDGLPPRTRSADAPVETLTDRDAIVERLAEASRATGLSVRNMQQFPSMAEEVALGLPHALKSLGRGISSRSIYGVELLRTDHHIDAAAVLMRAGSQIRCGPTPFARLLVADESLAVISGDPRRTRLAFTFVREPTLVSMLVRVFDDCWSFSREVTIGQITPAARQMRVLRLLNAGASEERAARELGLSARQVRRDLSALMAIAGTDNRIALGAFAAKQGWI